jgi:monoamine oxidase
MTLRPSRKDFLRMGAAAAASVALPARAQQTQNVDVAVIGAGLAGLTTARRLLELGVGSVVVLEARDRVGGRTVNLDLPGGHVVEGGGEWIGPGQDAIAALADELGIATFPAWYRGATTYDIAGAVSTGFLPDLHPKEGADFVRRAAQLDRMAKALPLSPWTAPDAAALDATTLGQWLEQHSSSGFTHDVFRLITRALMAGYPERISLLWFLWYLRSAGGLLPLILNDGGAQDLRFEGGSQLVSLAMATQLGDRIHLGEPVLSVQDGDGPVLVDTGKAQYRCGAVVVAMTPGDATRIRFSPALPAERRALNAGWARLTRLPIVKLSVAYRTPFWRDAGLNGAMQSDRAPLQLVFDNSPQDGAIGVLSCFLSVVEAPAFAARADRERLVIDELARYFGPPARDAVAYVEKDWATDPWSTGCITPLSPGLLSGPGAVLRQATGRVHWAGTETAERWCGFMDGAVRSGQRAAAEVKGALAG